MRTCLACTVALLPALVAAGCGNSAGSIIDSHRPAYATLRQKLARLAEKLPAERGAADRSPAEPLAPQLVLTTDKVAGNAEAVMLESLTSDDPRPEFDLNLSDNLTAALYWTGEKGRASGGDPDHVQRTLRTGLALRYLVVHRVAELELPEGVSDREYRPGHVVVEGFVFDLQSEELLAQYVARAQTDDKVEASVREDEKDSEALTRFARSSLWKNCRQQVRQKLEQVVGGKATIE
jgi:hypothetical protein